MIAGSGDGVAVVIVNYGTAELAADAVDSVLARRHGGRTVEVHLVDNASPGGDAARLSAAHAERGWGDRVRLWPEPENHGFGRGNNVVLRHLAAAAAPPAYVFLLNPDARLKNEAIAILADTLDARPRAAFAGARIEKPDGTAVSAAFRFPSPAGEFVRALGFGPVSRLVPRAQVPLPPDTPEGPVDWVAGAAVLMRFAAIRDLGFFDPAYFLYYEEVDLMHRAARAGWETLYVPRAEAVHAEGAATGVRSGDPRPSRRPSYWYRSWRTYFTAAYGRPGAAAAALGWTSGALLNHALALLPGRRPSAPRGFFRDFWQIVGRPLVGLNESPRDS
jgi:GT2 family glycosyltransferase